jgi:hypothetical protein
MRFARIAMGVCAAFGLTVTLAGQVGAPPPPTPLPTSEPHHVMGGITVEPSAGGQARIQFWVNTPTWKARQVVLEAYRFSIRRDADGSQLIESAGPVRVTGFTLTQGIIFASPFLQHAEGNIPPWDRPLSLQTAEGASLTWDRGFKLQILADGTAEWFCCPR